nr:immunoglobulin light chain junction region [Macaca mulatta]
CQHTYGAPPWTF